MEFWQIIDEIKQLKIQGARNVAMSALSALKLSFEYALDHYSTIDEIKKHVFDAIAIIESTRPTEPMMRNVLKYVSLSFSASNIEFVKRDFQRRVNDVLEHYKNSEKYISKIGSELIHDGMIIFTHCHSSTVVEMLKHAYDQGKHFEVHNTETRPLFQGRITAKELSNYGIKVVHYVDSGARLALKHADLFLFGADVITAQGKAINKIGTEMFAQIAHNFGIEVYSVTDSWKFDPNTYFKPELIEMRKPNEIWPNAPQNVDIMNYAFEIVDSDLLDGVITELGILSSNSVSEKVNKAYPWMFD